MPAWITAVQWTSRSVLGLLLFLSIWSIATMLKCQRLLESADDSSTSGPKAMDEVTGWIEERQWDKIQSWATQAQTVYAGTARILLKTESKDPGQVDRAIRGYLSLQKTRLEQGLTILATLGSNAPFIGLFGTVLGIIQAFGALGAHQNNTSDIMVGISEALVATAIGLFVAIPAVVAFNVFSRRLRVLIVNSEALRDLYLSKVSTKS